MANSIFRNAIYTRNRSRQMRGRVDLISQDVAAELNTYKNFGIFHTYNDAHSVSWDPETKEDKEPRPDKPDVPGTPGVRSIFNKMSAVLTGNTSYDLSSMSVSDGINSLVMKSHDWRISNNVPLLDTPENREKIRKNSGCTVRELVKASQNGHFGVATYSYADFMYCKHLGKVPNNYLITLRRFPVPVLDSIAPTGLGHQRKRGGAGANEMAIPIGTMVTWLGVSGNDMKNILKYSYNMAFEEKNAKWDDMNKEGGDNGILNSMEAMFNPAARRQYLGGESVPQLDNFMSKNFNAGSSSPYQDSSKRRDENKLYGPIDRVKKAYARSEAGLDWKQNITIVFEYELKAYNGINPRQAMLDLLASILSVTYTTGGFWGGGYRSAGVRQSSFFSNLAIFKAGRNGGGFTDFMDALSQDIRTGQTALAKSISSNGGIIETIKKAANIIGGMLFGGLLNKLGRPARYFANSLISDAPVGLWHITVGNPHHPIMQMGNMILTNTEVEHSGPLGLDDFPTNLKVTCTFDRGKPRDQYGIENLYMGGNDRIFHSMSGKLADMYKIAAEYKHSGKNPIPGDIVPISGSVDTMPASNSGTVQHVQDATIEQKAEQSRIQSSMNSWKAGAGMWLRYFGIDDGEAAITSAKEAQYGAFKASKKEETQTTSTST